MPVEKVTRAKTSLAPLAATTHANAFASSPLIVCHWVSQGLSLPQKVDSRYGTKRDGAP
jgi:hypothetical protein